MNTWSLKLMGLGVAAVLLAGNGRARAELTSRLVAYYPLNGNALDASGHGHDGLVSDAGAAANRFGQPDRALWFDGANSSVSVPDDESLRLSDTDFTVAAWIFETERNSSYNDCIVSKRPKGYYFAVGGRRNGGDGGHLCFKVSGGTDPGACSTGVIPLNEWHHVAFVYHLASQSMDMYIDGKWDSTTDGLPAPNPGNEHPLDIGDDAQHAYNNAYVFHGKIADVRIYNRALNEADLAELHRFGNPPNPVQVTGAGPAFHPHKIVDPVVTDPMPGVAARLGDGRLVIEYGGLGVGESYVLQSSTNLTDWTAMRTNIATDPVFWVTNLIDPAMPVRYFRLVRP